MNQKKRINPKRIPALYKKLGIVPLQGDWENVVVINGEPRQCGCLVQTLVDDKMPCSPGVSGELNDDEAANILNLPPLYVSGLIVGFDGKPMSFLNNDTPEFRMGFRDGKQSWKELIKAGVIRVTNSGRIFN
jgi:hypothetical protein